MTLPTEQQTFVRRLDPSSRLDFYPTLSRGDALTDMLQPNEDVASFTVMLTASAMAAGLRILETDDRAPRYANLTFSFWVDVDPDFRSSSLFDGDGVALGVEVTFVTDHSPSRADQFTVGVRVVNK